MNSGFWRDKKVLVTGHTGFKGGWLCLLLKSLGAEVFGYALSPPTEPSFFEAVNLRRDLDGHHVQDIRDISRLLELMEQSRPSVIFHLAAQSLVLDSYAEPVQTYATNVMGTVNVLECARRVSDVRAVVVVTSDKCYDNRSEHPHVENDPMGGVDPYSSSKGCAELVVHSYRESFFKTSKTAVASARAGNVIGGGDWSKDRLFPDIFRSIKCGQPLQVRNPRAVRPWQHVLEPLSGYMLLAQELVTRPSHAVGAWNFGPDEKGAAEVQSILELVSAEVPEFRWETSSGDRGLESKVLKLDSGKACRSLAWAPLWSLEQTIHATIAWNRVFESGEDIRSFSLTQIQDYLEKSNANASF